MVPFTGVACAVQCVAETARAALRQRFVLFVVFKTVKSTDHMLYIG